MQQAADRGKQGAPSIGTSLIHWAANVVCAASGRAGTLVQKVFTSTSNVPKPTFETVTDGLPSWSVDAKGATRYRAPTGDGPASGDVMWRRTCDTQTGQVLQDIYVQGLGHDDLYGDIPEAPRNITSTYWYLADSDNTTDTKHLADSASAKKTKRPSEGTRMNLMKGIRYVTAVFLLEAMVMSVAATAFAGNWSQAIYGTTRPDVVELFGGHAEISYQGWKQGWLALQPIDKIYGTDLFEPEQRRGCLEMIEQQQPRLAILEFPCTYWSQLTRTNYSTNSGKQKLKKL